MNTCAKAFTDKLDSKDLNYKVRELKDETLVIFPYENRETTFVFAGDEGEYVQMMTVLESRGSDEKFVEAVMVCNQQNRRFRFVKFVVDDDNDVMALSDAILDTNSAGDECFELLVRSLKIIKEARPQIMKVIYS